MNRPAPRRPRALPAPVQTSTPVRAEIEAWIPARAEELRLDPFDPSALLGGEMARAVTADPAQMSRRTLREIRGYTREDLLAIAELGHSYLLAGLAKLARVVFEGLQAISPEEPYFALALGLSADLDGDLENADLWYRKAISLAPHDPRPEVNRAEIHLEHKRYREARALLERALQKLKASDDTTLREKTEALWKRAERLSSGRT
jgi:Flp pilus assembly protein TadD